MKFFSMIALICSAPAAAVGNNKLRGLELEESDNEPRQMYELPKKGVVPNDPKNPIVIPPYIKDIPDKDDQQKNGVTCSSCWGNPSITYCCAYYGSAFVCDYYYC